VCPSATASAERFRSTSTDCRSPSSHAKTCSRTSDRADVYKTSPMSTHSKQEGGDASVPAASSCDGRQHHNPRGCLITGHGLSERRDAMPSTSASTADSMTSLVGGSCAETGARTVHTRSAGCNEAVARPHGRWLRAACGRRVLIGTAPAEVVSRAHRTTVRVAHRAPDDDRSHGVEPRSRSQRSAEAWSPGDTSV
jgi:hypothetical protein